MRCTYADTSGQRAVYRPRTTNDVPLDKIFATQKDINVEGRLIHVDMTVQYKQDAGQWMTCFLRGLGDICFSMSVFGVDPSSRNSEATRVAT